MWLADLAERGGGGDALRVREVLHGRREGGGGRDVVEGDAGRPGQLVHVGVLVVHDAARHAVAEGALISTWSSFEISP